jgi:hypothetical protein
VLFAAAGDQSRPVYGKVCHFCCLANWICSCPTAYLSVSGVGRDICIFSLGLSQRSSSRRKRCLGTHPIVRCLYLGLLTLTCFDTLMK